MVLFSIPRNPIYAQASLILYFRNYTVNKAISIGAFTHAMNRAIEEHKKTHYSSSRFYITDDAEQNLRLCIFGVPEEDITALGVVIEAIKDEMQ